MLDHFLHAVTAPFKVQFFTWLKHHDIVKNTKQIPSGNTRNYSTLRFMQWMATFQLHSRYDSRADIVKGSFVNPSIKFSIVGEKERKCLSGDYHLAVLTALINDMTRLPATLNLVKDCISIYSFCI